MTDATPSALPASGCEQRPEAEAWSSEAAEVAALLVRAGIDHASSLWFQLLELATEMACDWADRCAESFAPLQPRAAAVLGVRSLAADLLSAAPEPDEHVRAAAEACLAVCADVEPPQRPAAAPRRWGEGALPLPPQRPSPLHRAAGCC
jgi:hypothetical protein